MSHYWPANEPDATKEFEILSALAGHRLFRRLLIHRAADGAAPTYLYSESIAAESENPLLTARCPVDRAALGAEERISALEAKLAELVNTVAARDARIAELEKPPRGGASFGETPGRAVLQGRPERRAGSAGRKKGTGHGKHGHRMAPAVEPDRILDAPAPEKYPGCGGATESERIAQQFQTDLPEPRPITTQFNVAVRRCASRGTRVQGRHREQSSDALGAAAALTPSGTGTTSPVRGHSLENLWRSGWIEALYAAVAHGVGPT